MVKKVQKVSKHKKISVLGLNFAWYFVKTPCCNCCRCFSQILLQSQKLPSLEMPTTHECCGDRAWQAISPNQRNRDAATSFGSKSAPKEERQQLFLQTSGGLSLPWVDTHLTQRLKRLWGAVKQAHCSFQGGVIAEQKYSPRNSHCQWGKLSSGGRARTL